MEHVIVGCCHAGTVAAMTILHNNKDAHVTVIEKSHTVSFLSCGIALAIQGVSESLDSMFYNSVYNLRDSGCTVHTGCEVRDVDFKQRIVYCVLEDKSELQLPFDKLLVTTGSVPLIPIPNVVIDRERVLLCKNYEDARRLVGIQGNEQTRVAIIGAGYIGIELAQAFQVRGFRVYLIEREPRILTRYFCREITDVLTEQITRSGVQLMVDATVRSIYSSDGTVRISIDNNTVCCDFCILCAGFKPNSAVFIEAAQKQGIELKTCKNGALIVDDTQETSIPSVYAAGDVCSHLSMLTGKVEYVPLATTAVKQAMIAGTNMAITDKNGCLHFPGQLGTSVIKVFGQQVAMTGISNVCDGSEYATLDACDYWRPEFIPDNKKTVRILINYEKTSRRIVGAQIMSEADVMQMINILSLAIQNKMTIDSLMLSDFFFNPWYGKPLHIIQAAIAGGYYEYAFYKHK